ncbi:MAG: histidine kinase [Clostridia bacterium]|nr:histidine kinase [Clostridia bacterium]
MTKKKKLMRIVCFSIMAVLVLLLVAMRTIFPYLGNPRSTIALCACGANMIIMFLLYCTCSRNTYDDEIVEYFETLIFLEFVLAALYYAVFIISGHVGNEELLNTGFTITNILYQIFWIVFFIFSGSVFGNDDVQTYIVTGVIVISIFYISGIVSNNYTQSFFYISSECFVVYKPISVIRLALTACRVVLFVIAVITGNASKKVKHSMMTYIVFPLLYGAVYFIGQLCGVDFYNAGVELFCTALVLLVIFLNIYVARENKRKTQELELQNARMNLMVSQIQPHFVSNTLGLIRSMYRTGDPNAEVAMNIFISFLQQNFSDLLLTTPIPAEREFKHVKEFVELELLRWPDMEVEYDIQTEAFALPSTTIQPLVENAVKHGLMPLASGGKIKISSFEGDKAYYVRVEDNGVGFDVNNPKPKTDDHRKHIGLSNIKERLAVMVNGKLEMESKVGKGTVATIVIPKVEA